MAHTNLVGATGRLERGLTDLDQAVRVRVAAPLLGMRRRRKDYIGEDGGFGRKDVLHHQMRGQRGAGGLEVGSDIAGFSPSMYMPRMVPA